MLGDFPPERGIFSLFTCIGGTLVSVLVFFRYHQISELIDETNFLREFNQLPKWFSRMNGAILFLGFFMGFGKNSITYYSTKCMFYAET